jgi:hypothetical protein
MSARLLCCLLMCLCVAEARLRDSPRLGVFRILIKEDSVTPASAGTAFLIDRERGLLLTAAHVITPDTLIGADRIKVGAAIVTNGEETPLVPILSGVVEARIVHNAREALGASAAEHLRAQNDWALLQIDTKEFPLLNCLEEIPIDPLIDLRDPSLESNPPGMWSPGFPGMNDAVQALRRTYSTADVFFKSKTLSNGLVEVQTTGAGGFEKGQSGAPILVSDGRLLLIATEAHELDERGKQKFSKGVPVWRIFATLAAKMEPTARVKRIEAFFNELNTRGITTPEAAFKDIRPEKNPGLWRQYVSVYADMRELRGDEKFHVIKLIATFRGNVALQNLITDHLFGDILISCAAYVARMPVNGALLVDTSQVHGWPILFDQAEFGKPSRFTLSVANEIIDGKTMDDLVSQGVNRKQLTTFLYNSQRRQPEGPQRDDRLSRIAGFAKGGGSDELAYAALAQALSSQSISKKTRVNLLNDASVLWRVTNYAKLPSGLFTNTFPLEGETSVPFGIATKARAELITYEFPENDHVGVTNSADVQKAILNLRKSLNKIELERKSEMLSYEKLKKDYLVFETRP